jgi:erythritol kinase (D-erythritol 1-phosphate-forming)
MEKYIIGTDIGTTVAKVILFDENGKEVDIVVGSIRHFSEKPLYMEMDMREVYDEVCKLIRTIKENNNLLPQQIVGLGLSGQGEGLWPIGYDGEPVGNAIMWCDARASEIAGRYFIDQEKLMKIIGISGGVVSGGSGASIIRWLIENDPERFEKIKWIGTCFDWLKFKITGEMTLGESYTADVLNVHKMEYSDELFELYGIEAAKSKMPPLRRTVENCAPLSEHGARELGLCEGIPVTAGPFDMPACAVGVGAVNPGCVSIVLGTSNIICYPMSDSIGEPLKGMAITRPHACKDRWIRMVGTMTCTPNLDWAISRFGPACGIGKGEYEKVEELIKSIPIGCEGVIYHPYLSTTGERSPFMNPTARAQFTGLSLNHTAAHMLRAVFEGVGYSIMDCMSVMECYKVEQYRVSGGGSRSPFIMQMLADMTGVETVTTEGREIGAKGSAICASVAAGIFADMKEAVKDIIKIKEQYTPNPENTEKYRKLYELYVAIRGDAPKFWAKREEVMQQL